MMNHDDLLLRRELNAFSENDRGRKVLGQFRAYLQLRQWEPLSHTQFALNYKRGNAFLTIPRRLAAVEDYRLMLGAIATLAAIEDRFRAELWFEVLRQEYDEGNHQTGRDRAVDQQMRV